MKTPSFIFIGALSAMTLGSFFITQKGWGLDKPGAEPVSIKKDSTGRYRSHIFIGGGFHGGK